MHATASHPTTPLATDQYGASSTLSPSPSQTQTQTQTLPAAAANPDAARGFSITSFVLGVASVVSGWTFFVPVAGLVFGIIALRRQTTERTLALWGVWLNAAMLALTALAVLAFGIVVSLGLFTIPFLY